MPSLPLTLAARLLPVALLAAVGVALTAGSGADARGGPPPAAVPAPRYDRAPEACGALAPATVEKLVPGARTAGDELRLSDPAHRSGCSWHALKGYDYRWLDVAYEISAATDLPEKRNAEQAARASYAGRAQKAPLPGLGDEASLGEKLTEENGQQTREAVVVVRQDNAVVTVTYNGSDFGNGKAPGAEAVREGALAAAGDALAALDAPDPEAAQDTGSPESQDSPDAPGAAAGARTPGDQRSGR